VAVAGYPPADHILADLGLDTEVATLTSARSRLRATPEVSGADGGVRAGVLATVVDVVGGAVAVRSVLPDWMATADLTLQMAAPAVGPWVEARATILRRGRTTLVVEALVVNVAEDGADVGGPVGWASMTFTILPRRSDRPTVAVPGDPPVRWAFEGDGLAVPVQEALSIEVVDAARGHVSMPALAYAANSFGAVQGGVMALLAEVAGVEAVGAAQDPGAAPVVVTDLQVAYLALGRVGPVESSATVLSAGPGRVPRCAVVELVDTGAEEGGRLATVVTVGTSPVDAPVVVAGAGAGR
jgi:uncharacterized protein (TIGR00369 family)